MRLCFWEYFFFLYAIKCVTGRIFDLFEIKYIEKTSDSRTPASGSRTPVSDSRTHVSGSRTPASDSRTPSCSLPTTSVQEETPTTGYHNTKLPGDVISFIGPYPYDTPPGFRWAPNGWKLEPKSTDFKTVFLKKIKPVTQKSNKKCRKLDLRANQ